MAGAVLSYATDPIFRIVADDLKTILSDGAVVDTEWVDQISAVASADSGINGASANAILHHDATGNGHAGVLFDGSSGSTLEFAFAPPGGAGTWIFVATAINPGTGVARPVAFGVSSDGLSNMVGVLWQAAGNDAMFAHYEDGKGNGTDYDNDSSPVPTDEWVIYGVRKSDGIVRHHHYTGTGDTYEHTDNDGQTSSALGHGNKLTVGGNASAFFGGYIHEVLYFDHDIGSGASQSELNQILSELHQYYSNVAAGTPTVTVNAEWENAANVQIHPPEGTWGGDLTDVQWQIRRTSDSVVVLDEEENFTPSLPHDSSWAAIRLGQDVPLVGLTEYEVRGRGEVDTVWGNWSSWVPFSTTADSSIRFYSVQAGDLLVFAGKFKKDNPSPTNEAYCRLEVRVYDEGKVQGGLFYPLEWPGNEDVERRQHTMVVHAGVAWITVRIYVDNLDTGQVAGLDYMCGWKNPPGFGLSASLVLDGSNVDLTWETAIPAQVRFIVNTTGHVSSTVVEDTGVFTDAAELTSDTEEDVATGLSAGTVVYGTLVPYDNDGKRSGPRQTITLTIPGGGGGGSSDAFLLEDDDILLTEANDILLLEQG